MSKYKLIDSGFYEISLYTARKLCGALPPIGFEKICDAPSDFNSGKGQVIISRTVHRGEVVWSIRTKNSASLAWQAANRPIINSVK